MYHVTTRRIPAVSKKKNSKKSNRLRPTNSTKSGCLSNLLIIIIASFLLIQFSCNKKEISSLPYGGCFYFSKKDYKEVAAWRNKLTKYDRVYYNTINGKEYTFYTQDAKEINAYKRKYPDAIEVECYDLSDTIIRKVWKRNGNHKD